MVFVFSLRGHTFNTLPLKYDTICILNSKWFALKMLKLTPVAQINRQYIHSWHVWQGVCYFPVSWIYSWNLVIFCKYG